MNRDGADAALSPLERRVRASLQASADGLSAHVRSRLTRARYAALEAAHAPRRQRWRSWAPAGAVAAAVLLSVFVVQQHRATQNVAVNPESSAALDDLDLLSDNDGMDIAQAQDTDYDFYEWAAAEGGASAPGALGT